MAEMEKIRVLIVDDEPVARRGIRYLLQNEPDATIIGECGSGLEAVRTIESERPDLVRSGRSLSIVRTASKPEPQSPITAASGSFWSR